MTVHSAMKILLSAFLCLFFVATLLVSGCSSYDGGGSGFTQRDLELQRLQAERSRGR
jgi:hypothetical protein